MPAHPDPQERALLNSGHLRRLPAHEIMAHPQTSFLRRGGAKYPLPKMEWKMNLTAIHCRSHCLINRDILTTLSGSAKSQMSLKQINLVSWGRVLSIDEVSALVTFEEDISPGAAAYFCIVWELRSSMSPRQQ